MHPPCPACTVDGLSYWRCFSMRAFAQPSDAAGHRRGPCAIDSPKKAAWQSMIRPMRLSTSNTLWSNSTLPRLIISVGLKKRVAFRVGGHGPAAKDWPFRAAEQTTRIAWPQQSPGTSSVRWDSFASRSKTFLHFGWAEVNQEENLLLALLSHRPTSTVTWKEVKAHATSRTEGRQGPQPHRWEKPTRQSRLAARRSRDPARRLGHPA